MYRVGGRPLNSGGTSRFLFRLNRGTTVTTSSTGCSRRAAGTCPRPRATRVHPQAGGSWLAQVFLEGYWQRGALFHPTPHRTQAQMVLVDSPPSTTSLWPDLIHQVAAAG
ncbi:hypothetical protein AAFF_G00425980 [Aldrovandia affinis]|uniref:Uncharacterized protein n=1 Tax=Aldrovandia affinis TaxID=143900 RepID=A0AAD7X0E4_9TELE|nr:hypothetical protein AAFF_G00425980 [Aldrovandia affinis]